MWLLCFFLLSFLGPIFSVIEEEVLILSPEDLRAQCDEFCFEMISTNLNKFWNLSNSMQEAEILNENYSEEEDVACLPKFLKEVADPKKAKVSMFTKDYGLCPLIRDVGKDDQHVFGYTGCDYSKGKQCTYGLDSYFSRYAFKFSSDCTNGTHLADECAGTNKCAFYSTGNLIYRSAVCCATVGFNVFESSLLREFFNISKRVNALLRDSTMQFERIDRMYVDEQSAALRFSVLALSLVVYLVICDVLIFLYIKVPS